MPWTQYVITDVIGEEIVGTCFKKELQKTNQKMFRVEKVIKKKRRSFNCCIDEKDII